MRSSNRPSWRPLAGATAVLLVLSAISFVVLREQPARATHAAGGLDVFPETQGETSAQTTTAVNFTAQLESNPAVATLILMEVETGGSDPDAGVSFETPDAYCTVPTTANSCQIDFTFTQVGQHVVRFYVNHHQIDDQEGHQESGIGGVPGCQNDGGSGDANDTTDAIRVTSVGVAGSPTTSPPVPAGLNVPYNCTTPEPSGSGSPSPSPSTSDSGTATPSPSDSGSPSPSPSGSGSPSPSPSGSGSPSPSPSGSATPSPTGSAGEGEITIDVTPPLGTYGTDFVIQGDVTCNGAPVVDEEVIIAYQYFLDPPPTFFVAADTNAAGHYTTTIPDLISSSQFLALWEGNELCPDGAISEVDVGRVRPGVIVNPGAQTRTRGQTVVISGKVIPNHPGSKVYLMLLQGGTRTYRIVAEARLDSQGNYTLRYKMTGNEFLVFTVGWPTQHSDHVWNIGRNVRVN